MEKFNEQSQRLEMVLMAKGQYSMSCENCPIKEECHSWSKKVNDMNREPSITCEEVLTWYIIHGDFLPSYFE